jgi:hypothetical protein
MNDPHDPFGPPPGTRTTAVTILCLLIFIFGGLAVILNFSDWRSPLTPDEAQAQVDKSMEMAEKWVQDDDQAQEFMAGVREASLRVLEKNSSIGLLKLFASIGAFVGALYLWRMRRMGFHIYLASAIVWAFAPMFLAGANLVTWIYAIMYGIVVLIFALILAAERKHMVA